MIKASFSWVKQYLRQHRGVVYILLAMAALLLPDVVWASGPSPSSENISSLAGNVIGTFESLAELITAGAYIAGTGFAIGSVMKFKQHKDNPTQIPIGTPIAMLFISAALLFLPNIFAVVGGTLFGGQATTAGPNGTAWTSGTTKSGGGGTGKK